MWPYLNSWALPQNSCPSGPIWLLPGSAGESKSQLHASSFPFNNQCIWATFLNLLSRIWNGCWNGSFGGFNKLLYHSRTTIRRIFEIVFGVTWTEPVLEMQRSEKVSIGVPWAGWCTAFFGGSCFSTLSGGNDSAPVGQCGKSVAVHCINSAWCYGVVMESAVMQNAPTWRRDAQFADMGWSLSLADERHGVTNCNMLAETWKRWFDPKAFSEG